jgi:periplasmic divalent cation tolerance protein
MLLAWTTLDNQEIAEQLAFEAVAEKLAVCAQVGTSPIVSVYWWDGQPQSSREFRLMFKCLPEQVAALERWVLSNHPYDTPEWIVVRAERVGEKYLSWAEANSTNPPL